MSEREKHLELQKKIQDPRYFWHSPVDLGNGIVTGNSLKNRRFKRRLKLMQIPKDLTGKTVLDIGAWDGYFSFEFERRGAKRVLAIDTFAWDNGGMESFLLAKEQLKSKVEHMYLDVHDLSPDLIGKFDIVFFAGVLYHLKNPLVALNKIRQVTNEMMICETHAMLPAIHEKYPLISFFPGDENTTGPWPYRMCGAPTVAWLKLALETSGFSNIEFKYTPSCRWFKKIQALLTNCPRFGRCIVHASVES